MDTIKLILALACIYGLTILGGFLAYDTYKEIKNKGRNK